MKGSAGVGDEGRSRDLSDGSTVERQREDARAVVTFAAIGGLVLAILVLCEAIEPDAALAGAGIGLVCLAAIFLLALPSGDLGRQLGRVKAVTLGSLGLEFGEYDRLAQEEGKAEEEEESRDGNSSKPAETLRELRFRLEEKLAYLAKHVLAPDPRPDHLDVTYLNIGSLRRDKLLSDEHARIAVDILSMREAELRRLSPDERETFLNGANRLVDQVRAEVFAAHLRGQLEDAGWRVCRLFPRPSRRRDLLVQAPAPESPIQHHVIPVFTLAKESTLIEKPTGRLRDDPATKGGGFRLIVVPPLSNASLTTDRDDLDGIELIPLTGLLAKLGRPEAPVEPADQI